MPKIDNLLAILWMLNTGEKITAQHIAEKLELNIRTVYRYMDALTTSGVPIISDAGHNGGYSLLQQFVKAPLLFTPEEQASLLHATSFAAEAGYYGNEPLNSAILKLQNYSNHEQTKNVTDQAASLEIINRAQVPSLHSRLATLKQAIAANFSIHIQYCKCSTTEYTSRTVDPYKMIYWQTNWYVIGFCHLREDTRIFRIDRMKDLKISEDNFTLPEDFSAQLFFLNNLLPSLEEKELTQLVITGKESALNDVCQHWFLGHHVYKKEENRVTFLFENEVLVKNIPYLLLPYGKSIQIVEPLHLKKRLVEILSELIDFHTS